MKLPGISEEQYQRVQQAIASVPYARLLGIELKGVAPGLSVLSMPIREDHKQNHGVVHGGAIASLIDTAMAISIIPLLAEKEGTTTVDLTIHYLRALTEGVATAVGRVTRQGRRVIVVTAEVLDKDEKVVAIATSTYLRLVVS